VNETPTIIELKRLAALHGGELTTTAVIEAARPEESPLHKHFTWDIREAAERYWHVQAAHLIRHAKVTVIPGAGKDPVRVRAFLSPRDETLEDPGEPGTYIALDSLTHDMSEIILKQMARDVAALKRKYRDHHEVLTAMFNDEEEP